MPCPVPLSTCPAICPSTHLCVHLSVHPALLASRLSPVQPLAHPHAPNTLPPSPAPTHALSGPFSPCLWERQEGRSRGTGAGEAGAPRRVQQEDGLARATSRQGSRGLSAQLVPHGVLRLETGPVQGPLVPTGGPWGSEEQRSCRQRGLWPRVQGGYEQLSGDRGRGALGVRRNRSPWGSQSSSAGRDGSRTGLRGNVWEPGRECG